MVVGAGRRQPVRLGEDVVILLEEDVEEGAFGVGSQGPQARLEDVVVGGSNPPPEDAAAVPRERHAEVLEVPQDGAQGAQVVDAEDDVEAAKSMPRQLMVNSSSMCKATLRATSPQGTRSPLATITCVLVVDVARPMRRISCT